MVAEFSNYNTFTLRPPHPRDTSYNPKACIQKLTNIIQYMGGTSQDVKKAKKNWNFLAYILLVLVTIHIVFALLKIDIFLKHLESSLISSFDS